MGVCHESALEGGFPGDAVVKNILPSAGDSSLFPGWGRSREVGNNNPPQYSCLENSMDRGARWATVHGIAKSRKLPSK